MNTATEIADSSFMMRTVKSGHECVVTSARIGAGAQRVNRLIGSPLPRFLDEYVSRSAKRVCKAGLIPMSGAIKNSINKRKILRMFILGPTLLHTLSLYSPTPVI